MNTKEEIILKILNDDTSNFIHLEHDRKCIANILAKILDAIDESALELKRKEASDEILAKLDILTELGSLHDELNKIPWYKFSERNALKWKIIELDAKRLERINYGGYFKKDAQESIERGIKG